MKAKKAFAYAKLINIIEPSKYRTNPICEYHRQCGGCQIQALDYKAQLQFKNNKVKNNLIRIGGFAPEYIDEILEPIIGMDEPYHYRNKAQFPIGTDKHGNVIAGFYAGRTHTIIPNTDCAIGVSENKLVLERVLEYMNENKLTAYDEATGKGLVRHVLIRKGFATGEIMVCVVINGNRLPLQEILIEKLTTIPGMTSISISINKENTNVIMGQKCMTIWGKDIITDVLGGITFSISPLSFYQVNPVQTEKLYNIALEYACLTGNETVWDLYCGIGTISLFMARHAHKVYGVEIIEQAINDARQNAKHNNIDNAQFYVGKAEEVLPYLYKKEGIYGDVICVDPPRKGCDAKCLETILKMEPKRIVYVSCDSATLARDLKILCEGGYKLTHARAVDQFCHTAHCEVVCCLEKSN
jgi:23S rRNA (uracil1939-C5)-methyltransferase